MSDDPEILTLRFLRRIDEKTDRLIDDAGDLKRRISSLEASVAQIHGDFAGQSARIDRVEGRLERIERRLTIGNA
jgi:septal ring factor EnvC (AmiA/AmiB activator)